MPVSFKDKNGSKHVFKDHVDFVAWLKKNRSDIADPDAFAAKIERSQSEGIRKTSKFSTMSLIDRSRIINRNIITGNLFFDDEDDISVKNVDIFLKGIDVPIVTLDVLKVDSGASFNYIIDSRARAGEYSVVWYILLSGQDATVVSNFIISDDNIDRTLPLELQHLA